MLGPKERQWEQIQEVSPAETSRTWKMNHDLESSWLLREKQVKHTKKETLNTSVICERFNKKTLIRKTTKGTPNI